MREFRRCPARLVAWVLILSMAWWTFNMRMEIVSRNLMAAQLAAYNDDNAAREHAAEHRDPPLKCPDPEPCPAYPGPAAVTTADVASSSSFSSSSLSSEAVPGAVTFVLVATMNANSGPRAIALLASMQRFLDPENSAVHSLLVVVPEAETPWLGP
jgi:hypothetical protein